MSPHGTSDNVVDLIGSVLPLGPTSWQGRQVFYQLFNLLVHVGPPYLSLKRAFVSAIVCFQRLSDMTIWLPLRRSWPGMPGSSAKALYIVPDKRLHSPEATA